MQGGHHARLKAEVGGRIDKAKSTRDGHQTLGSERRGVEGTLRHRLQEEPKLRAPSFQSLAPDLRRRILLFTSPTLWFTVTDSSPSKSYASPAWENQSCPLGGPGAGCQGWGRRGPELLSCPGSIAVTTVAAPDPLLLAVSTVRGPECPTQGPLQVHVTWEAARDPRL